jgi:uncharacterized protein
MSILKLFLTSILFVSSGIACADYENTLKKAKQGDATAQNYLGTIYQLGEGVEQDNTEAIKWFRLSAAQGYTKAQNNLGYMYDLGESVTQNDIRAYMWKYLAALQGELDAAENRDALASRMTKQQVEEALKMAKDCQANKFKNCE